VLNNGGGTSLNFFGNPDLIFYVIIIPLSLGVHEFAHAFAADRMGDRTARLAGRLTLNPIVHLDLLGLLMIFFGPIGWAKPVPYNPSNFRNPRLGSIITAVAGPISNLLLAFICFFTLRMCVMNGVTGSPFILNLLWHGGVVNIILCVFNLIPLPPLDGSRIVGNLLPYRQAYSYSKLELYGPFILLLVFLVPFTNHFVSINLLRAGYTVGTWFGLT
jgi:Zn-dependent protease